jgi:SAM-dependent methyltransferase
LTGPDRVLALLDGEHRTATAAAPVVRDGYLDLLPGDGPPPTGPVQRLMLSRTVPRIYERWWRPTLGRTAKGVLGPSMGDEHRIARLLLDLAPGDAVLDVACGPGNFSRDFARAVGPAGLVVGIDASASMLARAARDTAEDDGPVVYVRGDAVRLPFGDATFDAVCCFAALHLFAEPWVALDHMTRVLVPGGRIALFTSCRTRSAGLRAADAVAGAWSGMRMFERDEVAEALAARGVDGIRRRVTGLTQFVGGQRVR